MEEVFIIWLVALIVTTIAMEVLSYYMNIRFNKSRVSQSVSNFKSANEVSVGHNLISRISTMVLYIGFKPVVNILTVGFLIAILIGNWDA